jgi:hypothetical protein
MELEGNLGVRKGFFKRFASCVAPGNVRYAYAVCTAFVLMNRNWEFHFKAPW